MCLNRLFLRSLYRGFLIALIALCVLLVGAVSGVAQATVVVEDASLTPTLTGQTTAVLSLRLISSEAVQLFDAKTPIAVGVRLSNYPLQDEQSLEADQAQHKKTEIAPFEQSIPIPANSVVHLDASGAHLRLIGIPSPLRVNQVVPLSLYFLDKKSRISILRVVARVRYKAPNTVPEQALEVDSTKQGKDLSVSAKSTKNKRRQSPSSLSVDSAMNVESPPAPLAQDQKNNSIADSMLSQVSISGPITLPLTRLNYASSP